MSAISVDISQTEREECRCTNYRRNRDFSHSAEEKIMLKKIILIATAAIGLGFASPFIAYAGGSFADTGTHHGVFYACTSPCHPPWTCSSGGDPRRNAGAGDWRLHRAALGAFSLAVGFDACCACPAGLRRWAAASPVRSCSLAIGCLRGCVVRCSRRHTDERVLAAAVPKEMGKVQE